MLSYLIIMIGFIIMSVFVYSYYSHDKELSFPGSKYAVASVIFSIFLSLFNLLVLPFDFVTGDPAENHASFGIRVDWHFIWKINIILNVISFLANIFWFKYYRYHNPYSEDDDPEIKARVKQGLIFVGKIVGVILVLLVPMTLVYGGRINIRYYVKTYKPSNLKFAEIDSENSDPYIDTNPFWAKFVPQTLDSILLGPFYFYGALVFYLVGGFGLATVPLHFFTIWVKRPRKPNAEDIVMSDILLREMTEESIDTLKGLIETREEIDEIRQEPDHDKKALKIKIDTLNNEIVGVQKKLVLFEEIYEIKKKNHNILDENPLKYFAALVFGFVAAALSVLFLVALISSIFVKNTILEQIFFGLTKINILYAFVFYFLLAMYCLYAVLMGYESLCAHFPEYMGYNQMHRDRTWMDTWILVANLLVPCSIVIVAYFIHTCRNFFAFTYTKRVFNVFVLNLEYISIVKRHHLYKILLMFSFIFGIVLNCSKGFMTDILTKKIQETKNNLKANQMKFQRNTRLRVKS